MRTFSTQLFKRRGVKQRASIYSLDAARDSFQGTLNKLKSRFSLPTGRFSHLSSVPAFVTEKITALTETDVFHGAKLCCVGRQPSFHPSCSGWDKPQNDNKQIQHQIWRCFTRINGYFYIDWRINSQHAGSREYCMYVHLTYQARKSLEFKALGINELVSV